MEPFTGALMGAIVAGAAVIVFAALAGLEIGIAGRLEIAATWTMILGGLAPYVVLKRQLERHRRAQAEELRRQARKPAHPPDI
jgi:uncharacterized membrane protein